MHDTAMMLGKMFFDQYVQKSGLHIVDIGAQDVNGSLRLESFTGTPINDIWNDFVAVFLKDKNFILDYPNRIQAVYQDYINGITYENLFFTHYREAQYETADLEIKLRDLTLELEKKRNALEEIYNSLSWRVTAPIRKMKNLLKINRAGEVI